ncbi:MAG: NAD-dependent epimerase/dehydratase family protein [Spirochaetota bacterium]
MKILVTGATGFIGTHVINELLKSRNHDVFATAIESSDKAKIFDWFKSVKYIECDLNNSKKNFFSFFEHPDLLIHLSWQGLPNYKELFHFEKNLFSNYFFIKNIIENGLKNLSVIGTCFEYGLQEGCLSESFETKPINSYGLAKDTLRKFILELNNKFQFSFKWIRLFYLYGEGQSKNSILEQLKTALANNEAVFNMSGGEQLRDYLPIEKVAEYIVKISSQKDFTGIINCCSGEPISIRRLVENYLEANNKQIKLNLGYYPYPDYEPMAFWGDDKKLKQIISLYNL